MKQHNEMGLSENGIYPGACSFCNLNGDNMGYYCGPVMFRVLIEELKLADIATGNPNKNSLVSTF